MLEVVSAIILKDVHGVILHGVILHCVILHYVLVRFYISSHEKTSYIRIARNRHFDRIVSCCHALVNSFDSTCKHIAIEFCSFLSQLFLEVSVKH